VDQKVGSMTLKFEFGLDFLNKFHHPMFNHSEVIMLTKHTNKQWDSAENIHLALLCYIGKNNVMRRTHAGVTGGVEWVARSASWVTFAGALSRTPRRTVRIAFYSINSSRWLPASNNHRLSRLEWATLLKKLDTWQLSPHSFGQLEILHAKTLRHWFSILFISVWKQFQNLNSNEITVARCTCIQCYYSLT